MRLVNLTPHRLRVLAATGRLLLDLPPCTNPPRVEQDILAVEAVHTDHSTIPVHVVQYRPQVKLPEPEPDVQLIVPRVLAREAHRPDLLFPDQEVRDTDGNIIGCRRLARFQYPITPKTNDEIAM